jgi:hypothetical protein
VGLATTRLARAAQYPHVVKLPKGSTAPSGHPMFKYDIVKQGHALQMWVDAPHMVRSASPFTLLVKLPSGKLKQIDSGL